MPVTFFSAFVEMIGCAMPPAAGTRQIGSSPRPSKRIVPSMLHVPSGSRGRLADGLWRTAGRRRPSSASRSPCRRCSGCRATRNAAPDAFGARERARLRGIEGAHPNLVAARRAGGRRTRRGGHRVRPLAARSRWSPAGGAMSKRTTGGGCGARRAHAIVATAAAASAQRGNRPRKAFARASASRRRRRAGRRGSRPARSIAAPPPRPSRSAIARRDPSPGIA